MPPVRLETATPLSQFKHSTTEPLQLHSIGFGGAEVTVDRYRKQAHRSICWGGGGEA